jgi:hypothetical protein
LSAGSSSTSPTVTVELGMNIILKLQSRKNASALLFKTLVKVK